VKVCRALTAAEAPLVNDCKRAVAGNEQFRLVDPVATSVGNFSFDTVKSLFVDNGTGGCITQIDAFLTGPPGGNASCFLDVKAAPATDASGSFVITQAMLAANGCSTLPPGVDAYSDLTGAAGTISFAGLSCERRDILGEASSCYAGTLEIRLTAQVRALTGGATPVTLTGAPFHVAGRFCGLPLGSGTCPVHP
jgi:hypothetical protein